jgi:hypothetical protein
MPKTRFALRNFAGIEALEALVAKRDAHPNPNWAPENDEILRRADQLSLALFGLTHLDAWKAGLTEIEAPEWEWSHDLLDILAEADWSDPEDLRLELGEWDDFGWDMRNAKGDALRCRRLFANPIICATLGVDGRLPDEAEANEADAERQAKALIESGWSAPARKQRSPPNDARPLRRPNDQKSGGGR